MKISRRTARYLAVGAIGVAGAFGVAAPASASTLLGTEYQHPNYGGDRLNHTIYIDGFTCTAPTTDVDAEAASMPSGWNDRISSFKNWSNCYTQLFEHDNFGGASNPAANDSTSVGLLNDKTSSIRYT